MRVVLPYWSRRAARTAFAATMAAWTVGLVGVVTPLAPVPRAVAAVLSGMVVMLASRGLPRQGEAAYRVWVRASRLYARITRRVLLVLCHGVVSVAGLAGTTLVLSRPRAGQSLWRVREALPPAAYSSQFESPGPAWAGRPWRGVADWALRSGNAWLLCLVPLLILVSMLDTEEQGHYPTGIYTLF